MAATGNVHPEALSPVRVAWETDIKLIEEAVRLVFTNRFPEAEDISKRGAEAPKRAPPARDVRSGFALHWTLVSLLQGMASLANDQLDECLRRVTAARTLASEMEDWVGKRVIMGVSLLLEGVVLILQNTFLRAGVNFVRAWSYIGRFDEAFSFSGYEAVPVRSFALFTLGVFNFVISMLPPSLVRVASMAGGPAIKGDQQEAINHLTTCHQEDGQLAPWAAVVLVLFYLNFKGMTGEDNFGSRDKDFAECERLLAWAEERYPRSGIFLFFRGDLLASQQKLDEAAQCIEETGRILQELQLPALELMVEFKKGTIGICKLDWNFGFAGFEKSMAIYMQVGRRSWVPTLAYLAALCASLGGEEAQAQAMLAVVHKYRKMRKRNWPPQDQLAFRRTEEYSKDSGALHRVALLDILEFSYVVLICLRCLDDTKKQLVLRMLDDLESKHTLVREEQVKVWVLRAELNRLLELHDQAFCAAHKGLELTTKLNARGTANASGMMLRWTLCCLHVKRGERDQAKAELKELERCPRPCDAFDMPFKLWKHSLRKELDRDAGLAALPSIKAELKEELHAAAAEAALAQGNVLQDDASEDGFYSAEEGDGEETTSESQASKARGSCQSVFPHAPPCFTTHEADSSLQLKHMMLEIAVHNGQEKLDGHTVYLLACSLSKPSKCHVEKQEHLHVTWVVKKRLVELRERLYSPVQQILSQEIYSEFFGAAPFALRGGPPGTTERLRQWCSALARCVNSGMAPPELVNIVRDMLDMPVVNSWN